MISLNKTYARSVPFYRGFFPWSTLSSNHTSFTSLFPSRGLLKKLFVQTVSIKNLSTICNYFRCFIVFFSPLLCQPCFTSISIINLHPNSIHHRLHTRSSFFRFYNSNFAYLSVINYSNSHLLIFQNFDVSSVCFSDQL